MAKKQKDQSQAEFDAIKNMMHGGTLGGQATEMGGTPMDKTERDYFNGTGQRGSAVEAIRRARRANNKPPLSYGG